MNNQQTMSEQLPDIHGVIAGAQTSRVGVDADVMPRCDACGGDRYILHGCCSGRDCGCMGQPVLMTNCTECNPAGDAEVPVHMDIYARHVEYRHEAA